MFWEIERKTPHHKRRKAVKKRMILKSTLGLTLAMLLGTLLPGVAQDQSDSAQSDSASSKSVGP